MNIRTIFIISLLFITIIGCGSSEMMISNSIENKIIVDGNQEDWNGKLKYFEDEKAAVGFQNDKENLYFCLVTTSKTNAIKIMSLGLTVWFKPDSDEQIIGLQYPKRMDEIKQQNLMGKNRNRDRNTDFEMTVNAMMQNQGELLLVDEENEIIYASSIGSNDGYEVKISGINNQFIYEAKIPIGENKLAQMPINIFSEEKVSIEFETGEIDLTELRKNGMGQQGMRGGMQGGGQGLRGDMQSAGAGSGRSRMGMERFNLEVDVKLSK